MSIEENEKVDFQEAFPIFEKLSEIGREIGDAEARARFIELVVGSGELTGESLVASSQFIESIKVETGADVERAVGSDEKHALQIRQQILHQLAFIILLLDTRNDAEDAEKLKLAEELHEEAFNRLEEFATEMQNVLDDRSLIQRQYFEKILQKVMEMLGH